jgi:hypothetical protein
LGSIKKLPQWSKMKAAHALHSVPLSHRAEKEAQRKKRSPNNEKDHRDGRLFE